MPTTTSNVRAPNGTAAHTSQRGCYLLTASEMSVVGTNTAINAIGFYLNSGTNGPAVTGTIQIYLQNTNDVSYTKGTSFSTAINPMSSVYNNTMVIPFTAGQNTITLPLPSDFNYTGAGLYVAWEWMSTGPFATGAAVYQCDNSIASGGASNSSTNVAAPDVMTATNTRPLIRIGYVNTYTNEAQVCGIYGNGKQPLINGSPYSFSVQVKNNSGVAITNVVPTLSVSGTTTFVATATIASIAAGGTAVIGFPAYTPTAQGMHTVNVTLPPDDNNANNAATVTQSTTCNIISSPPVAPINSYSLGVGFSTSSGLLLNRMSVPNTSSLSALRLGIANHNPNTGNSVYGVVTTAGGVILATTNTITITGAMLGTWQTFYFPTDVNINANTNYFIGMAQPQNSVTPYFPLATWPTASTNIPAQLYATSILNGGFISIQTPTLGWFAIEGLFNSGINMSLTPQTSTICSGTSVSIAASGATSYSWSNGSSNSSITVTPNIYTAYTATGTAIVGTVGTCQDVKTSYVYVNITPTINCPNGAVCPAGGSFTLNPSGAATYTFSNGPVITPSVTDTYTITGTSGAGCPASNTAVVTVSVSNAPTVSITGPTVMCHGGVTQLNAGGATSYTWSTGSSASIILMSPTVTTTYSLVGTFGSCTASAVHQLSVSPVPNLSVTSTSQTLCAGNSATLLGLGANSYSWSTGDVGISTVISPTATTSYSVVGATNPICSQTVNFTQVVDPCIGFVEHSAVNTEIKVYPNPNNGLFTVHVSTLTDHSTIEIYNSLGELLSKEKLNASSMEMNLKTLAKGLYFIKLKESDKTVKTTRIIIN